MAPIEAENTTIGAKVSSEQFDVLNGRVLTSRAKVYATNSEKGGRLLVISNKRPDVTKPMEAVASYITPAKGVTILLTPGRQLSIELEGQQEIRIDEWKFTSTDKTQEVKEG